MLHTHMPSKNNHVFLVSLALILIFAIWGILGPDSLALAMQSGLALTIGHFGWFYLISMFSFLGFSIYLALGRFGRIRLGGDDAEPEFSNASWFSMLFAAGMGIGLVFWGAAEPISHFAQPPLGIVPESPEAARAALRFAFFHWGLHPWAAYCLVALALAYAHFNKNRPMLISSVFESLLGSRIHGTAGKIIDIMAVIATVFGVATSLGFGTLQIASGLNHLFGVSTGMTTNILIICIATAMYLTSAMTGLDRGIRLLSNTNLLIGLALMLGIFLLGPTAFILDSLTTTLGDYANSIIAMSLRLTPFSKGEWVANWTLFYWAWWVSWAPFVGTFIARISKGRTIKEFVTGVLILPSMTSFIWFSIFGGTSLYQALFDGKPLVAINAQDVSMTLFAVLENLPLGTVMSVVAIVLVTIFFVTSADSATFVLALMSTNGNQNPKNRVKLTWGLLIAVLALVLLISGGLKGLQTMAIMTALPFMLLMLLMCFSLYRDLDIEAKRRRKLHDAREKAVDRLMAIEKASRNEPL
nr:BCCT family transporter [uncultured organism]